MRIPSLKHLYYLVSVHHYQHFGKAAKACYVSQSTLSTGISSLEKVLNVQLIERDSKKILFTPLAEEVVKQAKQILLNVDELSHMVERYSKPFGGRMRLGIIPTIAPFLLPQLMLLLRHSFPLLDVYVKEEQSELILEGLRQGELDLIVLALPYPVTGFETQSFYQDPFYFAFHKDSQYIDDESIDREGLKDYSQLPEGAILLLEDGHCLRDHALDVCKLRGSDKINPFAATSLHTLVQMVNHDLGVTFLPQIAIRSGILNDTDIVTIEVNQSTENFREIGLAWRSHSTRKDEIHKLLAHIQSQIDNFL